MQSIRVVVLPVLVVVLANARSHYIRPALTVFVCTSTSDCSYSSGRTYSPTFIHKPVFMSVLINANFPPPSFHLASLTSIQSSVVSYSYLIHTALITFVHLSQCSRWFISIGCAYSTPVVGSWILHWSYLNCVVGLVTLNWTS